MLKDNKIINTIKEINTIIKGIICIIILLIICLVICLLELPNIH